MSGSGAPAECDVPSSRQRRRPVLPVAKADAVCLTDVQHGVVVTLQPSVSRRRPCRTMPVGQQDRRRAHAPARCRRRLGHAPARPRRLLARVPTRPRRWFSALPTPAQPSSGRRSDKLTRPGSCGGITARREEDDFFFQNKPLTNFINICIFFCV